MKVTVQHIKNLIERARVEGADSKRLADLEQYLKEQESLSSVQSVKAENYTAEELDNQGNRVTFYSTAPMSAKDKSYFERVRTARAPG